jgi:hypothetical protein
MPGTGRRRTIFAFFPTWLQAEDVSWPISPEASSMGGRQAHACVRGKLIGRPPHRY